MADSANHLSILPGTRVTVYGQAGTVLATLSDGYRVRLDGETLIHDWHPTQVVAEGK